MSYGLYLVISLAVTVVMAMALAGPLSLLPIFGFWVAYYYFVSWSLNSASVKGMSDARLRDILSDWTHRGFNRYASSHLSRITRTGNHIELERAIQRILEIHDELIVRGRTRGLDVSSDVRARNEFAARLPSVKYTSK